MVIYRLRIRNFKSYEDETTIDFTQIQGYWWISGQIGAGKTTIGEAIVYGLYGTISGKSNQSLLTWGAKHGLVELWCESRGKNIYIRRELNAYGQSPMSLEVDGEPIVFTNKRNAQAQLEQDYLDAPRTTMELLCIISFGNFKSLSTLNAKDTKLFLDQVLGFNSLTAYVDACKDDISTLKTDTVTTLATIRALEGQVDRMENYTFIDGDPVALRKSINDIKIEIAAREQQRDGIIKPLQTKLGTLNQRLGEVKALGANKRREIDFIKKGTCPTCGAPIDQSQLEVKEAERKNLVTQYTELSTEISDITAQISRETAEATNYITEQKNRIKSQENELVRLEEQAKQTRANQGEINKLKEEIANHEEHLTKINSELAEYERLQQILQVNIRKQVLDSFIPTLNSKIKEFAGMLSMHYVPEFDSMFKCSIRSATIDSIPTASLSTGQLKMVDMIIILAVISTVISKIQSNIIFLDELFSNLDPRTRSELIAVLRTTLPASTTCLIVSHQDMDSGLFDGHIKTRLVPGEHGFDKTEIKFEPLQRD